MKFAGVVDDIGAEASRAQQAKIELREKFQEVAELRDQLEDDFLEQLSEEESEALRARVRDFEARESRRAEPAPVDPPPAEPAPVERAPAEPVTEEIAAAAEPAPKESVDFHAEVDARLQAVEARLKDESRALDEREAAAVERADRLSNAGGADDESNVVKLALETAQKIAAERARAITAQTDRLEAKNVGALARG